MNEKYIEGSALLETIIDDWNLLPPNKKGMKHETVRDETKWELRMNDFPDEPMYSLFIDGEYQGDFDNWPKNWNDPFHENVKK